MDANERQSYPAQNGLVRWHVLVTAWCFQRGGSRPFAGPSHSRRFAFIHGFELHKDGYALNKRFSISLTIPFLYCEHKSALEHDGVHTHTTTAGGLGDVRLVGNVWLLDPEKHPEENMALSLGVKAPTGDYKATDTTFTPTGPVIRPVAPPIQPGDGGWGILLEMQAYERLFENA